MNIHLFGYHLGFGIRAANKDRFYWFYNPLLRNGKEYGFVFYWWMGHHFFIFLRKDIAQ